MAVKPVVINTLAMASGTTLTGGVPAGVQGGDLLRVLQGGASSGFPVATDPDFVPGPRVNFSPGIALQNLWKFASGTVGVASPDIGDAVVTDNPSSAKRTGIFQVVRGVDTEAPFATDFASAAVTATSINRVLAAQTTDQPDILEMADVLYLVGTSQLTAINFPAGLNERMQQLSSANSGPSAIATADSGTTPFAAGASFGPYTVASDLTGTGAWLHWALAPITTTQWLTPTADTSAGLWLPTGASTLWEALADLSGANFVQSPNNPSAAAMRLKLSTPPTPSSDNKFGVAVGAISLTGPASSYSVVVDVQEGPTVRASRTINSGLSTSPVDLRFLFTRTEAAAVTDWSNLYARVTATAA